MHLTPDEEPRRLLSPTAHTHRCLRVALQAALPPQPTACDEEAVESALLDALEGRADEGRRSEVSRRLTSL